MLRSRSADRLFDRSFLISFFFLQLDNSAFVMDGLLIKSAVDMISAVEL